MMGNLGATLEEVAWVSTGYIVANVIVLPLTSWLSERFGRRNYYTGSILLFTLASFFCGAARSLEALVFWRVIQGVGGGALISTAQAILFDVFPLRERATAMAIFGMGVMVGPTWGPRSGGSPTATPGPGSPTSTCHWDWPAAATWRRLTRARRHRRTRHWLGLVPDRRHRALRSARAASGLVRRGRSGRGGAAAVG
jgi:MFS family permease